ncbi:MAG: glycosyltransferase WbuB, partial [Ignavibacteriae bacterium]|nr:glycosyltransferase WbuB [Ignavibacteriota bacterium]
MKQIIRFLTQHFYPDTSSTGNLLTELAVGLAEKGYEIEVFTFKPLHIHNNNIRIPRFENYKSINIYRSSGLGFS